MDNTEENTVIELMPMEIIQMIFSNLSLTEMIKCRAVCTRWRVAVDDITKAEFWRKACQRDFGENERDKAMSDKNLSFFGLYKSLHLWQHLSTAKYTWKVLTEFDSNDLRQPGYQIHAWNGQVAAHKRESITYFNPETVDKIKTVPMDREYGFYIENEYAIAYLCFPIPRSDYLPNLKVIFKNGAPQMEVKSVWLFLLMDETLYYFSFRTYTGDDGELHAINLNDQTSSHIYNYEPIIWTIFYNNGLYVLDKQSISRIFQIYNLIDNEAVLSDTIPDRNNLVMLSKNHLTESALYREWIARQKLRNASILFIRWSAVKILKNIIIIGSEDGLLQICKYDPASPKLKLDVIREYNLRTKYKLKRPSIRKIEITVNENCVCLVIATWMKVFILNITR